MAPSSPSTTSATAMPQWQSDSEVSSCILCGHAFTFFYRKHHCRRCGRVVCGNCSPTYERYLPTSYVVTPDNQQFLENPYKPHRTCTECADELRMIWSALDSQAAHGHTQNRQQGAIETSPDAAVREHGSINREMLVQTVTPFTNNDFLGSCPVCDRPLYRLAEEQQEAHVDKCLKAYSSSPAGNTNGPRRKRMLISKLNEKDCSSLTDCMICYEDFEPGQKIGRLECMCVFHEKCILEWFSLKGVGVCPLHNQGD